MAGTIRPLARQGVDQKARYVSWLLHLSYFLERRHKNATQSFAFQSIPSFRVWWFSSAFGARDLRKNLGGPHADYKKYLRPFWIFEERNEGYSKKRQITKAYLLKDEALEKLNDAWKSSSAAEIFDNESGRLLTKADFPANGVLRTSHSTISIPSIVPISIRRINFFIATEEVAQKDVYGPVFISHNGGDEFRP